MKRKKQSGKVEDESLEDLFFASMPPDPRAIEKTMFDLTRILDQHEFASEKELNDFLQNLIVPGQRLESPKARTPLEEAQEVMYEAWGARSHSKRMKLAKKALSISPDCADAYVLLAEESAKTPAEAIRLYEQGVAAGERAIGPGLLKEYEGDFWGVFETRPYMRAREGLALSLWHDGFTHEAIKHFEEMLRLNPNDNQGVRYYLVDIYLETENDDALRQLLKRYKDDYSAQWFYTQALMAYKQYKGGVRADKKLNAALDYNPYVADYLLGRKRLPQQLSPYIGPGNEDEAISYVIGALPVWYNTPGSLDWLRKSVDKRNTG
jgi:tetratricopeptide (TPR) repeat protein